MCAILVKAIILCHFLQMLQMLEEFLFCFIINSFLLRGNFLICRSDSQYFWNTFAGTRSQLSSYEAAQNNLLKNLCPSFIHGNAHSSWESPQLCPIGLQKRIHNICTVLKNKGTKPSDWLQQARNQDRVQLLGSPEELAWSTRSRLLCVKSGLAFPFELCSEEGAI